MTSFLTSVIVLIDKQDSISYAPAPFVLSIDYAAVLLLLSKVISCCDNLCTPADVGNAIIKTMRRSIFIHYNSNYQKYA
jgi:hypothetical protein